ncbi:restriction endonuclease subunit S [Brevibacillus borstelensis]|uniref:restriction endonuclease subunit S n=1 Tax=Brevibacillus borstelensis TaxID=45462 RepID=UPI00287FE6B1|nr:restriction endonuclease subunit S [Brevibacillus borstelensis]MED1874857.1 restriction endonuclease subunit S [Brevibacillus borstelensis]WNF04321.1 restriction endonuclease subunit S [Brevibacillus borstelensis]
MQDNYAKVGDLFNIEKGLVQSSKNIEGEYNFITASSEWKTHYEYSHNCEALVFAMGAAGSLGRTHYVKGKFIASDLCFVLTPKAKYINDIDLKFYYHLFNLNREEIVKKTATGTSKLAINMRNFSNLEIPYLSLEKQKEARELIEKIHTQIDYLTFLAKENITFIEKLRHSFLLKAIQGELVQQDPNDEPASVLIEKINALKEYLINQKIIKKEKHLPEIREDEVPYDLPNGWKWVRLGEITQFQGGYAFKSDTYVEHSNNQLIRLGNVKNNQLLLDVSPVFIPDNIAIESEAFRIKENDILITMTGTRGKRDYFYTCLVQELDENKKLFLNQRVGCLRSYYKVNSKLLNIFLKSTPLLDMIFETETGTANQGNIGAGAISNLLFPLPPLKEQERIVEKVDRLMNLCDDLERAVEQSLREGKLLLKSILKEVFEKSKEDVVNVVSLALHKNR